MVTAAAAVCTSLIRFMDRLKFSNEVRGFGETEPLMKPADFGYANLAEACGRWVLDVIFQRHRVWTQLGTSEGEHIKSIATQAFHWAQKSLNGSA